MPDVTIRENEFNFIGVIFFFFFFHLLRAPWLKCLNNARQASIGW